MGGKRAVISESKKRIISKIRFNIMTLVEQVACDFARPRKKSTA
jgi:hypothetical protein